ncbi:MAG: TrkH family potassium uptake protein [Streptococcaceae bacterium]|jgi:Trk-type K+ transport system membrane component|nr:TrkH family potassium uptake protein [Streptococcaceae bacterium]
MHILRKLNVLQKFSNKHLSSIQIIVFYYLAMTIVTFLLFQLPFFRKPNTHVSFIDMAFMAVSTISVTGLTTFDIHAIFNNYGILLLEILFQIGGFGIMMISTFFFIVAKRKITLRQRQLIAVDMNQTKLSGVVRLIKHVLFFLIMVQIIFGIIFGIYFHLKSYYPNFSQNLFWGLYDSVSAVTNSGFNVRGNSLIPFKTDYLFLYTIIFLMSLGSIGFPVLLEITEWSKKRKSSIKYQFSLFTKMALAAFIGLFLIGVILIFLFEINHFYRGKNFIDCLTNSAFYSMSTRNAGLQLNSLTDFQPTTLLIISLLMFIGASPSSVGGGVRTTTFAIVLLYTFSFLKSKENVSIFNRCIPQEDIKKAVSILNLSIFFCFFSVLILMATQPDVSIIEIILEVASAFGTTGLSLGITSHLTIIGKTTIATLMFIGRVGTLYILMLFIPKKTRDLGYKYPTEKIIIG